MLEKYSDILNLNEVMEILSITKGTMYSLIHSGTIPAFRVGTKIWRIKKIDLINYINSQ